MTRRRRQITARLRSDIEGATRFGDIAHLLDVHWLDETTTLETGKLNNYTNTIDTALIIDPNDPERGLSPNILNNCPEA